MELLGVFLCVFVAVASARAMASWENTAAEKFMLSVAGVASWIAAAAFAAIYVKEHLL